MTSVGELGEQNEVDVAGGRLRYRDTGGCGPVVVLVHGALVNSELWREVVPGLVAAGARCVTPDWPFGSHQVAVPGMDLTPPGVADLFAAFLERLDLSEVTLVANDTGGGLTQVFMASNPARVARVVLTPSDSFEAFFPPRFAYLPLLARVPGGLWALARAATWPPAERLAARLPFAIGGLAKHGVDADLLASWLRPARNDPAVRADAARFLGAVDRRHTLAAAEALCGFDRPVLLAWAFEDRVFPISLAHRLAERLPRARIVGIPDSYTFVALDQPERLVAEIVAFLRDQEALPGATTGTVTDAAAGAGV